MGTGKKDTKLILRWLVVGKRRSAGSGYSLPPLYQGKRLNWSQLSLLSSVFLWCVQVPPPSVVTVEWFCSRVVMIFQVPGFNMYLNINSWFDPLNSELGILSERELQLHNKLHPLLILLRIIHPAAAYLIIEGRIQNPFCSIPTTSQIFFHCRQG